MITGLIVIFLIVLFISALIASPLFRVAALIVAVVAGVGIWALYNYMQSNSRQYEQREAAQEAQKKAQAAAIERGIEERSKMIKPSDLQVRDAKLSGVESNSFRQNTFTAALHNSSTVDLSSLGVFIRLYDCDGPPDRKFKNCEVVGEDLSTVEAQVPAGQTRQINGKFAFPNTPKPRNMLVWRYEIRDIRAQ